MKKTILFLIVFAVFNFLNLAFANPNDSPIGLWRTTTDLQSKDAGIIEIFQKNGVFYGKIKRSGPNSSLDICQNCPGNFKNKPVTGMTFMWGFTAQGNNNWDNGKVIDPRDGKIYKAAMSLEDNGNKLLFRGYWLVFWRTQTWTRMD